MRVCVIGSGGREHALAHVLGRSAEVVVTPGNPGIPGSVATPRLEMLRLKGSNQERRGCGSSETSSVEGLEASRSNFSTVMPSATVCFAFSAQEAGVWSAPAWQSA